MHTSLGSLFYLSNMPNWAGGNSKAVEARAKKAATQQEQREQEQKRKEAEEWKDSVTAAKVSKKVGLIYIESGIQIEILSFCRKNRQLNS